WTRDVLYVRDKTFIVYDRTHVTTASDQHMRWHLMFTPAKAAATLQPPGGATRYDVTNPVTGFLGAATAVLPPSAPTTLVDIVVPLRNVDGSKIIDPVTMQQKQGPNDKVYRLEVRPSVAGNDQRWLTV